MSYIEENECRLVSDGIIKLLPTRPWKLLNNIQISHTVRTLYFILFNIMFTMYYNNIRDSLFSVFFDVVMTHFDVSTCFILMMFRLLVDSRVVTILQW